MPVTELSFDAYFNKNLMFFQVMGIEYAIKDCDKIFVKTDETIDVYIARDIFRELGLGIYHIFLI